MEKINLAIKSNFTFLEADSILNRDRNVTATATNKITNTPITEEILLEAMEKIERFQKKENMQKLLREFLEAIEKNDIKEILFFEQSKILKKKGQAIFSY